MSVLASILLLSGLAGTHLSAFAQYSRTVTFKNNCPTDAWFSPTTGAAGTCAAGCPPTSTCASNGYCYYNKPTPTGGSYRVPAGGTNSVVFPFSAGGSDTVWNGNWAFCQLGQNCNQPESVCDSQGCAAQGPFALVEVDFSKTNVDFYDISIISGVTVPVSMTPAVINSGNTSPNNPYMCGNPGSPTPATAGLGPSSWGVSPPSIDYQWVTPPSSSLTTCSSPSNCPSGQTCGLVSNSGSFEHVCGYLSGFWSAGAVCGQQPNQSLMNCDASVTNGPFTGTDSAFYGCGVTSGSCYGQGADTNCCGCVNWQTLLGTNLVPAATAKCVNSNPNWISIVLPTIEFLKKACPNCYTFPYDDFSSTFTCADMSNGINIQNYEITMCPNGVSWAGPATGPPTTGPPTNNAGKCNGVSYTSAQVCDNGHICPTGQYYCNGSCYSTSNNCCSNGSLAPTSGPCTCNGQGFGSSNYVCDNNFLCPSGTYSCGGACYNPSSYSCCGTGLTAVGQGC